MRHFLSVFLLGLGGVLYNSYASLPLSYKGNLGTDVWYFPKQSLYAGQPSLVLNLYGELDLTLQALDNLEFRFNGKSLWDIDNSDRNRPFLLKDLYGDFISESIELRAGYQTFSWKTVESYSPADFLNQTDRELDFLDPEKLGQLSVRMRWIYFLEEEHTWELYYLPLMESTAYPQRRNRYDLGFGTTLNGEKYQYYRGENSEWRPQGAIRYQSILFEDIDVSAFYFNGYERSPRQVGLDSNNERFGLEYYLTHKTGFTFQGVIENWLLKGEGVYNVPLESKYGDPYGAYNLGVEYTYYSLWIQNHDVGLIVELLGDTDVGKDFQELKGNLHIFQSHVFLGMRYTFNNTTDRSLLGGAFVDYLKGDVVYTLEYEERVQNSLSAVVSLNGIASELLPSHLEEESFLKQFEHTFRLSANLQLNF